MRLQGRKCRDGSALVRSVRLPTLPTISVWSRLPSACGSSSLRARCAPLSAGDYAPTLSHPPRARDRSALGARCVRIEVGVCFTHHHKRDPRQVKRGSKLHNFGSVKPPLQSARCAPWGRLLTVERYAPIGHSTRHAHLARSGIPARRYRVDWLLWLPFGVRSRVGGRAVVRGAAKICCTT